MRNALKRLLAIVLVLTVILSISMISSIAASSEEATYKAALKAQGFTDIYLDKLWKMHQEHPNWEFKAVITGLDWDAAVKAESKLGENVVWLSKTNLDGAATRLYRSQSEGEYTSEWIYDYSYYGRDWGSGGKWISCTPMCVAYYMNPVVFIGNTVTMLQFESLEWIDGLTMEEAEAAVEAAISGTFMSKTRNKYNENYVTDDGYIQYKNADGTTTVTTETYSHVIADAAYKAGLNPCYLASKICGESGSGAGGCMTGTHSSNPGYYNYLNIGASDSSEGKAVVNGLNYAKKKGWDTPMKSIYDGAVFVAEKYIAKGQNTMYFQKFNVTSYQTYGHQYCTAVNGVVNITYRSYKSYKAANLLDEKKVFYIPVFKNMPDNTATSVSFTGFSNSGVVGNAGNLRTGVGLDATKVVKFSAGTSLTVGTGYRDQTVSNLNTSTSAVSYRMYCPLWIYVKTGSYTGYMKEDNVDTDKKISINVGSTYSFKYSLSSGSTEKPRFMTLDTRIATIDSNGVLTAVSAGTTKAVIYTGLGCFDVVNVVVSATNADGSPTVATSSTYNINNAASFISKVPLGTTVGTLLNGINEKAYLSVTKDGKTLSDSDTLSTGCVVSLKNGQSYKVIITGDANGDGKISVTDSILIRDQILGTKTVSTEALKASDINGDGKVSVTDSIKIRDHILGTSKISSIAY